MKDWKKELRAPTEHDLSLQNTFALSFQELLHPAQSGAEDAAQSKEISQKRFLTARYLAPNSPIPLEIFEKALQITSDTCDEALGILYGLGLLRKSEENQPTIHPPAC